MAYFLRTRRLDIQRLERKPQESLEVVHAILTAALKEVIEKLKRLERTFYGIGKSAYDEVQKWTGSIRNILTAFHTSAIISNEQIEDIVKKSNDPAKKFMFDMFDLNKLKEVHRKVKDGVPDKFKEIILDVKTVLKYAEKYCLSFYDLEDENEVDYSTAKEYEQKRCDCLKNVRTRLDTINAMAEKFKKDKFYLSDLSSFGIELSRKADSSHAPFLMIFPECCEHIRLCCSEISSWLDEDANYDVYVANDVKDFEGKREEALKLMRDFQQKYHQMSFRLKQVQSDCSRLEEELLKLEEKDDELTVQEELLVSETNEMQTAIETKEFRRDALIKNASIMHPQVLYDKYNELSEELRDLKLKLPFAKRQLLNVRYKLSWIGEKKAELNLYQTKLSQVQGEMDQIDTQRQELEIEHDSIARLLDKAKQIHLFKSTPDAVTKIYHEQPVEVNKARLPGQRGENDPFERGCAVVTEHIELEWPALYRALPFYPQRGEKTIDADIKEFSNVGARVPLEKVATKALHRWRRFHTRAKLEDLKSALSKIRRGDVVTLIDLELNPPEPENEEDEGDYSYVDESLIPYVKEVEKFDKLLAKGKMPLEDEAAKFMRLQAAGKIQLKPEIEKLLRMQTMAKIRVK